MDTGKEPLHVIAANVNPKCNTGFLLEDSDSDLDDIATFKVRQLYKGRDAPKSVEEDVGPGVENEIYHDMLGLEKDVGGTANESQQEESTITSENTYSGVKKVQVRTCAGKTLKLSERRVNPNTSYEHIVAARSKVVAGRARKSYYGIDIHELIDECAKDKVAEEATLQNVASMPASDEVQPPPPATKSSNLLWTEKYRARKFADLVGDERTHRSVLRWIKAWDPIVFPSSGRSKGVKRNKGDIQEPERVHRKVLLITGPPGLGKTTLAHVCAKQAGYEVQEINASDERSRDIVKGRIKDMVCTENVRPVNATTKGKVQKIARPVCVVVDEVDGVVGGSGSGGDGGFIKALVDLLILDSKNTTALKLRNNTTEIKKKRKGDNFRLLRPLVLICNDLYHPSLRLLRQGNMAEIIHVRKPPLNMVIPRLQSIFEKEGIPCDSDGIRQLCEATWGISTKKEDRSSSSTGDGDMRGILVVGEWVASKLRADVSTMNEPRRLTKKWLEQNILGDLLHGGGAARGLGRGSSKEIVEKVFAYNAGFPVNASGANASKSSSTILGHAEAVKDRAMQRLKAMVDSSGEDDRIMTGSLYFLYSWCFYFTYIHSDCFSTYPSRQFQDDNFLSKPCLAYDWLHFHDTLSSLVHTSQEWELAPYLSSPILAFHHFFSSTSAHSHRSFANFNSNNAADEQEDSASAVVIPFTGLRASYEAHEAQKAASATLAQLQTQLCLPLLRSFRSADQLSTDLLPYVLRILNPDVKPVVVGGSERGVASVRRGPEKELVQRAVNAMIACGVKFDRSRVEGEIGTSGPRAAAGAAEWIYRMEPPLDALGVFETAAKSSGLDNGTGKVRFAVRQVLEQEWKREVTRRDQEARVRRVTDTARGEDVGDSMPLLESHVMDRGPDDPQAQPATKVKRDFFGRPIVLLAPADGDAGIGKSQSKRAKEEAEREREVPDRVWVTFHEGFSNAVRKGITLKELLEGL